VIPAAPLGSANEINAPGWREIITAVDPVAGVQDTERVLVAWRFLIYTKFVGDMGIEIVTGAVPTDRVCASEKADPAVERAVNCFDSAVVPETLSVTTNCPA
jgi:hypothetical protein